MLKESQFSNAVQQIVNLVLIWGVFLKPVYYNNKYSFLITIYILYYFV